MYKNLWEKRKNRGEEKKQSRGVVECCWKRKDVKRKKRAEWFYKPKEKKEKWASSNSYCACPTGGTLNVLNKLLGYCPTG